MNAEKIAELEARVTRITKSMIGPCSVVLSDRELLDLIATAKEVERLKAERVILQSALEEQRRQMAFHELPEAFAATMRRMIDSAIAKVQK